MADFRNRRGSWLWIALLFCYLVSHSSAWSTVAARTVQRFKTVLFGADNENGELPASQPQTETIGEIRNRVSQRLMDRIEKASSNNFEEDPELLDMAASVAKKAFPLLGVKSLGVDFGLVRTGMAYTSGFNMKPLGTLVGGVKQTALKVAQKCEQLKVSRVVVGLPLSKDGTEPKMAAKAREFCFHLAVQVLQRQGPNVTVQLFDERYTTKEAVARIRSREVNQQMQSSHGLVDSDSAAVLLEEYYRERGKGSELVKLNATITDQCLRVFEAHRAQELRLREKKQRSIAVEDPKTLRERAIENARLQEERMRAEGTLRKPSPKKKKKKHRKR